MFSLCLLVCLSVSKVTRLLKSCGMWTDFHETWWEDPMRRGPGTNRLDLEPIRVNFSTFPILTF